VLHDEQYGNKAYPVDMKTENKNQAKNTAYYHRSFKEFESGAMGSMRRKRGYSDPDLFMAMTSEPKVAPMKITQVKKVNNKKVEFDIEQRWTYAIPLEIIYMTPLQSWNPLNLEYKGHHHRDRATADFVNKNGRNGGLTPDKAFNGTNARYYYQTPVALFRGASEVDEQSAADTVKGEVGVLDNRGRMQRCMASGIRIFFPEMEGVGIMRQRWPISPAHTDGDSATKELDAFKYVVLDWKTNSKYFYENVKDLGSCPAPRTTRR